MLESALIHRVREVGRQRAGGRSEQGSYATVAQVGPWIAARVMEMAGSNAKARRRPGSTDARAAQRYELLLDTVDEAGVDVVRPTASSIFETDCPVLGNPTIELNGEPEDLNDGVEMIGWLMAGDVPKDRS